MTELNIQSLIYAAYELAFTPIPLNAVILGAGVAALLLLRRVRNRWLVSREMAELIPQYGRKVAKWIIKARREAGAPKSIPYYHNEPWEL